MKKGLLILGNQLFDLSKLVPEGMRINYTIFMREDEELCNYFQFHKHKIAFFFLAMRRYADELKTLGFKVHYEFSQRQTITYENSFSNFLDQNEFREIHTFEIEDKFFELRIKHILNNRNIPWIEHKTPMFLTSREEFKQYLSKMHKPFMKTFYQFQRKKLEILINENKEPIGGKWSYDLENRKKLPRGMIPPSVPNIEIPLEDKKVLEFVEKQFPNHPGNTKDFWLPTTRGGAKSWLQNFLKLRLYNFGAYEDALSIEFPFIYHSILTPFLNVGLLTPREVIEETLCFAKTNEVPIESLEGFIRQIIGWREFVRGIYQNYSEIQFESNFFKHHIKLNKHWYQGTTGITPLDHVIKKCNQYGYAHHIERLMVVGSLMVLLEIDPKEAYRWFMEMFIDSSDWVMGPNVFGMALFSDGGIFSTKPYICGSNYYKKMGTYPNGEWEVAVDGLYWKFIEKHKVFFLKNPRLSFIVGNLDKMNPKKKIEQFQIAEKLQTRITEV
ncbi:cryptochrome/photolyase family protein [Leptospira terpstrae]|uniref:cryptochrome/photolyase family protein n=1 Tax=Leptospira terpstrae TaxID=293075 RepID=UPI003D00A692